jgi:hypothetical protein
LATVNKSAFNLQHELRALKEKKESEMVIVKIVDEICTAQRELVKASENEIAELKQAEMIYKLVQIFKTGFMLQFLSLLLYANNFFCKHTEVKFLKQQKRWNFSLPA